MKRRGFTLIELLVVITIILLVSAVALRTVPSLIADHSVAGGAQLLQATLVGSRDAAAKSGNLSGIRLIPDATLAGCYSSWLPLESAPDYTVGRVNVFPGTSPINPPWPCLVIEESPGSWDHSSGAWLFVPNDPSSWYWTIRAGEKIQIGSSKPLTIFGPMTIMPEVGNPEAFVNIGNPGSVSPFQRTFTAPDGSTSVTVPVCYLFAVNGIDDGHSLRTIAAAQATGNPALAQGPDGFVDNGWDGVNNDGNVDAAGNPLLDLYDPLEWEVERWPGSLAKGVSNAAYTIRRRPVPASGTRAVALSSNIVIDGSRSRFPIPPWGGVIDLPIDRFGHAELNQLYAFPSAIGITGPPAVPGDFLAFWVCQMSDVGTNPTGISRLIGLNGKTGLVSALDPAGSANPLGDLMRGE